MSTAVPPPDRTDNPDRTAVQPAADAAGDRAVRPATDAAGDRTAVQPATDPARDRTAVRPATDAAGDRTAVQPVTDPREPVPVQPTTDAPGDPTALQPATDAPGDRTAVQPTTDAAGDREALSRREVVARQQERFGGMKFGASFFGWLTATGMAVLLTALLAAAGAGVSLATNLDETAADPNKAQTVGLIGAIVLLVIIFLSYFAGGYVAGRMARFNGARQGFGVWLWAVIIAIVVAVLGFVGGTQFNLLAKLNTFPRIPINEGDLTTAGLITAVAVAVVALVGAILGGLAGMSYHRRVDKEGLGR